MRKSRRFLIVASILCSFIFWDCVYFNYIFDKKSKAIWNAYSVSKEQRGDYSLVVNTSTCQIARTYIMPEYLIGKWKPDPVNNCTYEKVLGRFSEEEQVYYVNKFKDKCCFHEINRVDGNDNKYKISTCIDVTSSIDVKDKEMFYIKCGKHFNFEANLPSNRIVEQKIEYWKNVPEESRPINVILFGIDTVSRSHAFRSIPKTVEYITYTLGFHDFQGYHSIAASTLYNFKAFLMGLTAGDVKKTCLPKNTSPYDSCPLIWQHYNAQNYVTMYLEDGHQTFNFGGQGGFQKKPTDYYIHSWFNAMEDLRTKAMNVKKDSESCNKHAWCTSTENVPQFMKRHTERFIRKFYATPFFAFTWFAYPFHDYFYSLAAMDDQLLDFFKNLEKTQNLLENTLIVFLADHGDRFSFFQSKSDEGHIERSLPQFFIRIPEKLIAKYPGMDLRNVMSENVNKLTTGFDLHHTLHHLLHLSANFTNKITKISDNEFNPVLSDRSSLFLPIDPTNERNCTRVHINSDNCACNYFVNNKYSEIKIPLEKVMPILEKGLNDLVRMSPEYSSQCSQWRLDTTNFISKNVINANEKDVVEYLFKFSADPGGAIFEARLKVKVKDGCYLSSEIVGSLGRINAYGKQSSCIHVDTDEDKEMLQFCYCKKFTQS